MSYEQWPYLGVLAVLVAASFGLPIPEDIPLLTGGFLCHRGLASFPVMLAVAMVGVLIGDIVLFSMGRTFGQSIVEHRFVRRLVNRSRLLVAERLFERHGLKIIFAGRFLPGLRPMIFMSAGVLKVPFWQFATVNGVAACISVPTLVVLGYLFGHNLHQLQRDVRAVGHLATIIALFGGLIGVGLYLLIRQRRIMASAAANGGDDDRALTHSQASRNQVSTAEREAETDAERRDTSPPFDSSSSAA